MTKSEFKNLIADSTNPRWFEDLKLKIGSSKNGFNREFNGISSLYAFLYDEVKKWEECQEKIPTFLNESKSFFKGLKNRIEKFAIEYSKKDFQNIQNNWNSLNHSLSTSVYIFNFDNQETVFLIDLFNKNKEYSEGAYYFIVGELTEINRNKNNFIGALIANDFFGKETVSYYKRKDSEQKSFDKLKTELTKTIEESSSTVTEHLINTNQKFKEYANAIDELKESKEKVFDEWLKNSKKNFEVFDKSSNNKIKDLEKLYAENLSLKAPADYWEKRAKELRINGQWWLVGLISTTFLGVFLLFYLLNSIGTGEFETIFKSTGSSIKWSILLVTFISFLAFLIRTFTKLVFSSFHLSRDAQERKQLTFVYLALKENNAVNDSDRNIILQSLFSRADTGLLKEDSSPTMPTSSFIERVAK